MQQHALAEPLKDGLWYAKAPNGTIFNLGPWPTLDDGLQELNDCDGPFTQARTSTDAPGIWEFGLMTPWVAIVPTDKILLELLNDAAATGPLGEQWVETVRKVSNRLTPEYGHQAWIELGIAFNLALKGWLARHEIFPHFGSVSHVHRYRWDKGQTHQWRELCQSDARHLRGEPCGHRAGHTGRCETWLELCRHAEEAKHPEIALATTNPELKTGIEWTEAAPLPGCQKTKDGVRCIWHGTRMQAHTCFFPCQERAFEGILAPRCRHEVGHEGPHDFRCEKPTKPEGQCDLPLGHAGPCHSDDVPF